MQAPWETAGGTTTAPWEDSHYFEVKPQPLALNPDAGRLPDMQATTRGGSPGHWASFGETMVEPMEQLTNPRISFPRLKVNEGESRVLTIGKEAANIALGVPEFASSTLGLMGMVGGVTAPVATAGAFTVDMLHSLGNQIASTYENWDRLSDTEKTVAVTDAVGTGVFAAMMGRGTAHGLEQRFQPGAALGRQISKEVNAADLGDTEPMDVARPLGIAGGREPDINPGIAVSAAPWERTEISQQPAVEPSTFNVQPSTSTADPLSPVPETTPAPIPATPPRAATPSPAASELGTGEVISGEINRRDAETQSKPSLNLNKSQGHVAFVETDPFAGGRNTPTEFYIKGRTLYRTSTDYPVGKSGVRKSGFSIELKGGKLKETGETPEQFIERWRQHQNLGAKQSNEQMARFAQQAEQRAEAQRNLGKPASTPSASPRLSGEPPTTPAAAVSKVAEHVADVASGAKAAKPEPALDRTTGPRAAKEIKSELVQRLEAAIEQAKPESQLTTAQQEALSLARSNTYSELATARPFGTDAQRAAQERARADHISKIREERNTAAKASGLEQITIEIPGDGTFTIWNTKEALQNVLDRAKKISTASGVEPRSAFTKSKATGNIPPEVWVNSSEPTHLLTVQGLNGKSTVNFKKLGKPIEVKGFDGADLYLTSDGTEFKITEPQTGLSLGTGKTIAEAVKDAEGAPARLKEKKSNLTFQQIRDQNVEQNGRRPAPQPIQPKPNQTDLAALNPQSPAGATGGINTGALGESGMGGDRGTSAVGDPMMPPLPPGVPGAAHSGGRMPVALERIVPGLVDVPTVMDAFENVIRSVGGDAPIRTGRFYQQARGIFKTFDKVIRLREADNIPTAAHEVAHAVSDKVFGSSGSRALMAAMKGSPLYKQAVAELRALGRALYGSTKPAAGYTAEGFSELTRLWLTTEDAARRAPSANKWLETELFAKLPELKDSMTRAREQVDVWRGQGAEGRAEAMMKGPDSRLTQLRKTLHDSLGMEAQVEELAPLEQLSRGFERITGNRLPPSKDPFMLATAMRGSAGHVLENFVERGVQDIWGNVTGPSLKEAFARLKPQDATQFRDYLRARRSIERWSKNQNPGMTLEDATYLRSKLETPAFIDAAQKYYQWWDGVLEYVKQANPASNGPMIDAVRLGSKDYVPLARVLPESSIRAAQGRLGGGLMKMHGSGLPVKEIYLQSLLTAERLIARAHKDMVLDSVFKLAETEGMGWLVERVPRTKVMEGLNIEKIRVELEKMGVDTTPIPDDTLVQYASHLDRPTGSDPIMVRMVNGKPEWYQVPAGVYDLLSGLDAPRMGKAADLLLGAPNRLFKLGTTGLRASFSLVTNPLRDLPTFFMQSLAGNPASRAAEYVGALHDIVKAGLSGKESPAWQTFKQLGVSGSNFLGGDIRQAQREARGLFHGKLFRRVASPLETLREAFSFTESAPRLAEMNLVGKEMGWKPGQPMTPDQAIAMTVAAKRITTDFSAGGKVGKYINQAVPFYNASIQGARSFGRAFRKEQGFKTKEHAIAKATLTGLGLLTVPVLFNWWNNKDKDWYRNLPWRERYLYTNVDAGDGTVVQVPRPQEWGNLFMVIPEMVMDAWYQKDPEYVTQGLSHIFATSNPADFPVLLKLAKEQWQNRIDFFDRPIVPRGEIDLPPGQQRAYFSSILAKSLGDAFPNKISPRRVDAAVRGLFGGLGSDVLDAPGQVMKMLGIADSGRPQEAADFPVLGRLFRRGGEFSANSRYLADFWDGYLTHQAKLKGNARSVTAGGQPTITPKEYQTAQTLTAYHAAIKLQLDIAQRAKDPGVRQKLYHQASETARLALEATK